MAPATEGDALQSLAVALQAASTAEKRLREVIDAVPQGIVLLDEQDRYVLWNDSYAEIYALTGDLLQEGCSIAEKLRAGVARGLYVDAVGREESWVEERLALLAKPGTRHEQWLSDGRCILVEERYVDGCGTIGLRVDITDLKHRETAFRLLFERNPLAMFVYDTGTGLIRAANESANAFFGYEPGAMEGLGAADLFLEVDHEGARALLASDFADAGDCWQMLRADGEIVDVVISTRLSDLEDYSGTIVSVFDVTERRRIEKRMAHMARHDELTGLANRSHCREFLARILQEVPAQETVTLALVDLDHFKSVNDTYGHHFGDLLLREAAQRMSELVPSDALLCRIGGDEFAVIFTQASLPQAEVICRSLITALCEPFHLEGSTIHIGATVGTAASPYDSSEPETLMRYADLALYAAKADKRGSCRSFSTELDEAAQEKHRLETDLRAAVSEHALEVHYQPIVSLETGEIEAYEALLRWHHPERGCVPPDTFIPLAEELGLIEPIGRFVLGRACHEAMNWPDTVKVSVNVSPIQFRHGNLLSTVINALSQSGLRADRLELEITEAVLMEKGPRPAAIIRNLRAFGIGISLDDFGTGYSSLSYLLNYPFTKIKIDKSFVLNLQQEAKSRAVVRAIIGLGRSIGVAVAAEGIEHTIDRDYLRSEGCTQGQGFLFGMPTTADRLTPRSRP